MENTILQKPKCDICDLPATMKARDVRQVIPEPLDAYLKIEPYGEWHYGCDNHPVESRTYYIDDVDYPRIKVS